MRRWVTVLAVVVPVAWVAALFLLHQCETKEDDRRATRPIQAPEDPARIGRFPRTQFYMEHDRFLAATDPRTVAAAEATWLRPDDEVFGVVVKGEARAYPIPMISYHHVVNDVIHGIPIAVTY